MEVVLDANEVRTAVGELAARILESDPTNLCFVGIERGGVPLARRLAAKVREATGKEPEVGSLDIALYRDDLDAHPLPRVGTTRIDFPIQDRHVVLVDDVLYTGRTVRAALDELKDFGRPSRVLLAVLVDRPGRELPIQADFVGRRLDAKEGEMIEVRLEEKGGDDAVVRRRRG